MKQVNLQVTLFPFLSVLICLIGVLVVLTSLPVKRELHEREVYEEQIRELKKEKELVSDTLKKNKVIPLELEVLKLEKETLLSKKDTLQSSVSQYNQETLKELQQEISNLEDIIAKRGNNQQQKTIYIWQGGSGYNQIPFFVECKKDELIFYNQSGEKNNSCLIGAETPVEKCQYLSSYIEQAKATPNGRLVFLIHPEGVPTYLQANKLTDNRLTKAGKLPIYTEFTFSEWEN